MPKRQRSKYIDEQRYRKRRLHITVSPSSGNDIITDHAVQLRTLQLEVDILRAQIVILRRQIEELVRERSTGEQVEQSSCVIC